MEDFSFSTPTSSPFLDGTGLLADLRCDVDEGLFGEPESASVLIAIRDLKINDLEYLVSSHFHFLWFEKCGYTLM